MGVQSGNNKGTEEYMVLKDAEIKFRVDTETASAAKVRAEELDIPLSSILRQLLTEWLESGDDYVIRRVPKNDK